jgi:hypothetical protein
MNNPILYNDPSGEIVPVPMVIIGAALVANGIGGDSDHGGRLGDPTSAKIGASILGFGLVGAGRGLLSLLVLGGVSGGTGGYVSGGKDGIIPGTLTGITLAYLSRFGIGNSVYQQAKIGFGTNITGQYTGNQVARSENPNHTDKYSIGSTLGSIFGNPAAFKLGQVLSKSQWKSFNKFFKTNTGKIVGAGGQGVVSGYSEKKGRELVD